MINIFMCAMLSIGCSSESHPRQIQKERMKQIKIQKTDCIMGFEISKTGSKFNLPEKRVCLDD
jgi:hypothetical protein